MNADLIRSLQRRFKAIEERAARHHTGTVTTASPLAVTLGGAATPFTNCKRLASYTPVIGDKVSVLRFGPDLIVLGKIV